MSVEGKLKALLELYAEAVCDGKIGEISVSVDNLILSGTAITSKNIIFKVICSSNTPPQMPLTPRWQEETMESFYNATGFDIVPYVRALQPVCTAAVCA